MNPSNIEAYSRLGTLFGSQNRLDEAKKEFEELARRQPKTAVAATTMVGTILTLQKNTEEARKQYERALALDPQMPVAANNLAWDYTQNEARIWTWRSSSPRRPKRSSRTARASADALGCSCIYQKGLSTLAISLARGSRPNRHPSDASIRYQPWPRLLEDRRDQKKARASLEGALKISPAFKEAEEAKKALATIKG